MRKFFAGAIIALVVLAGGGVAAHAEPAAELVSTSVALSADTHSSTYGDEVTFTAAVTGGNPTGNVAFKSGAIVLGTEKLNASGEATLRTVRIGANTHRVTATYLGDANHTASPPSNEWSLSVEKKPFTGKFVDVPASMRLGDAETSVTFDDGTVFGTRGVTLSDTYGIFGQQTVPVNGTSEARLAPLWAGSTQLVLEYSGDENHEPGTIRSEKSTVVYVAATSVQLDLEPSTVAAGGAVEATATVSSPWRGWPITGKVEFFDKGQSIGVRDASAGIATLSVPTGTVGEHTITAKYLGLESYFDASPVSTAQTLNVTLIGTTTQLEAPAASTYGEEVALTASLTPASATGTVSFTQNGAPLVQAPLSGGEAVYNTATLAAGNHTIGASYGGDATHNGSIAKTTTVRIAKAATTTKLSLSKADPTLGETVVATATVTAQNSAGEALEVPGKVVFFNNGAKIGEAPLDGGSATIPVKTTAAGEHQITAQFIESANFEQSALAERRLVVQKHATETTLAVPAAGTYGDELTLTASVDLKAATGDVRFESNGKALGSATIKDGGAKLTTAALGAGSAQVTATYLGDDAHAGSASEKHSIKIARAVSRFAYTITPAQPKSDQQVTVAVSSADSGATGTVIIEASGPQPAAASLGRSVLTGGLRGTAPADLATVTTMLPLIDGSTTAVLDPLAAGDYEITARYSGDANHAPMTLDTTLLTITAAEVTPDPEPKPAPPASTPQTPRLESTGSTPQPFGAAAALVLAAACVAFIGRRRIRHTRR